MGNEKSHSLDVLGVKPLADSVKQVTQAAVDGAAAFLSRICLPAAEEFGLLLRDKVARYRAANAVRVAQKAEQKLALPGGEVDVHAHPRLVGIVLGNGSWTDADDIQELWAGLLASSCTPDGQDETNLIFMNLLGQLTSSEVRILKKCCEVAAKYVTSVGWVGAETLVMEAGELAEASGHSDFHRLDLELDHLRSLELIHEGFSPDSTSADVTPSAIALQLYVRCQGFRGSPVEFFGLHQNVPRPTPA